MDLSSRSSRLIRRIRPSGGHRLRVTIRARTVTRPVVPLSLPAQPTPLIGRAGELHQVRDLLQRPDVRLVTLIGTAGAGKTRLALAVAAEVVHAFEHGIVFVDLTTAAGPADVVPTIAHALGLQDLGTRVRLDHLGQYLVGRQILLLLDNFEHVLGAGPQIAELLTRCLTFKVLVTSRSALRLRWEQEYPVLPLDVPGAAANPSAASIVDVPAVALFVQRARAARPDFVLTDQNAAAVAGICRRLDGLPLAIELAAVRTKLLSPQALLPRLDRRMVVLTDGARELPPRLQTLRSAIAWSFDLLSTSEQVLFRRLAVFAGGCTPDAVAAVCSPGNAAGVLDMVASLVDKSLLRVREETSGEPRFAMLETLREFATEQLHASEESETVHEGHAHVFLRLVEEATPHLSGADRDEWLPRLSADYENVRTALSWMLEHREGRLACRMAAGLRWFWYFQGRVGEGRRWLERALDSGRSESLGDRADALEAAGHMAWLQGDHEAARRWLEDAIAAARGSGNRRVLAYGLIHLGFVSVGQDEARRASLVDEGLALARELGDSWWAAVALLGSGTVALGRGDRATARARLDESLMLWRRVGDAWFLAQALNAQGDLARSASEHERAAELYSQSLVQLREHGITTSVASVLHNLGYVSHHQGDDNRAVQLFREALDIFVDHGDHRGVAECLIGVAVAMLGLGQLDHAVRLLGAGEALLVSMGSTVWPTNLPDVQQTRAIARARMDPAAYAQNWSTGQAMGPEQALAFARRLADDHPAGGAATPDTVSSWPAIDMLTPREREIALLLARGFSNHQVAEELVITDRTVETHVKRILGKLGIHSRHQVADIAERAGFTGASSPNRLASMEYPTRAPQHT